jgi:DNA-nicking Smr family endonuclease
MTTRKGRGAGGLTGEDAELWDLVRGRFEPLRRGKERVLTAGSAELTRRAPPESRGPGDESGDEPPGGSAKAKPPQARKALPGQLGTQKTAAAPAVRPRKPAPIVEIERRKARRIATGRLEIEATLDLHGMRQADAHAALRRFVHTAQSAGKKLVKVITGKGAPLPGSDRLEHRMEGERGVLRRMVPQWLDQPDLRPLVVATLPAGRGHGGEGALIVELRRVDKKV